jgi:hypothetical protein
MQLVQVAYARMISEPGPLVVGLSKRLKCKFPSVFVLDQSTLDLHVYH